MINGGSNGMQLNNDWVSRIVVLTISMCALIWALFPTYSEIVYFWLTYSPYNHCILIIPISVYLIYEKRLELFSALPETSSIAILFFAANCILWVVGGVLSISFFQHLAGVGLIVALVWTLIGDKRASVIIFPLAYLYFCVPEGEALVPYLRDITASVVVNLLRLSGIPVYLEGLYLTIPSGQFHVAKACSGINYLIATLAVGTVFAYLRFRSSYRRIIFMILAIVVPIVANGIRAYGIVMVAHLSDYKYAMGIDHFIYGWVFFGVIIFALFSLGSYFSDTDDNSEFVPSVNNDSGKVSTFALTRAVGICSILLAAVIFIDVRLAREPVLTNAYKLTSSNDWTLATDTPVVFRTKYDGTPTLMRGRYTSPESLATIDLEMAIYRNRADGEVESRTNALFDDNWVRVSGPDKKRINGLDIPFVNEYVLKRAGDYATVWEWFDVSGVNTATALCVKWQSSAKRLSNEFRGAAKITIAWYSGDGKGSDEYLEAFLSDLKPSLSKFRNDNNRTVANE